MDQELWKRDVTALYETAKTRAGNSSTAIVVDRSLEGLQVDMP